MSYFIEIYCVCIIHNDENENDTHTQTQMIAHHKTLTRNIFIFKMFNGAQ